MKIKLKKKRVDQVSLFYSPLPIPFNFAKHSWIVTIDKKGNANRWEVWQNKNLCKTSWGYVHKNLFKNPLTGMIKYPFFKTIKWESKLRSRVSGNLATKIINFIDGEAPKYIYKDTYHFVPGPNSNTFIQWIINKFPESKLTLPRGSFGKNY
jgi:hypothetical protein